MLHLFALIHANFAQLMYHCSSEGSHWRFNYLLDFDVCVCVYICACVLSLAYDECLKRLWLLWGTSCDIICFLHGFSYNYKRLCKSASICECQSTDLNPKSAGTS